MADNRDNPGVKITEREWQREVVAFAKRNGWTVIHFPHVLTARAAGWPDLVLIRIPEIVFAELKTDTGRVSPAQQTMMAKLHACHLEAHVWRPRDLVVMEIRLDRAFR